MLGGLFSGGAADLVKGVGGVIDNLHTSKEEKLEAERKIKEIVACLLYTSPSPRDKRQSRMPSSA